MVDHEAAVRTKFLALRPVLDERLSRLWAGAEAEALGDGGIAIVERATGLSRTTIRAGRDELRAGVSAEDVVLVRRAGGGRPRIEDTTPEIVAVLESLVDPVTRGDPESPAALDLEEHAQARDRIDGPGVRRQPAEGRAVAAPRVGYSLQATQKTIEGTEHPDRDEQFAFINDRVDAVSRPRRTRDLGGYEEERAGRRVSRTAGANGSPAATRCRCACMTSSTTTLGKAIPYGVYDLARNTGWVSVGIDHDTPAFAVESIARWWRYMGKQAYPDARELLITADAGGSNGARARLWKVGVAALRRRHGLAISVSHFPPGTSQVEQDRAPAVLPHHRELAGASAHRSRDDRAAHWECPHGERFDREGEARYADRILSASKSRTQIWTTLLLTRARVSW